MSEKVEIILTLKELVDYKSLLNDVESADTFFQIKLCEVKLEKLHSLGRDRYISKRIERIGRK